MFLPILVINFRLQYEGTPKYLGEGITGPERGYRIQKMVHALLKGKKMGMPVDAQANGLDLTAHAQSFPAQEEEADDCDVI